MVPNKWAFPAKEVREQAAVWLMRTSSIDWTVNDQAEFDAWLAASEFHRASYWRLEAAWNEATRLAALRPIEQERSALKRVFTPSHFFKAVMMALFVGIVAVAGSYLYLKPSVHTYATAIGGHRTLALSDGSVIELDTDTVLSMADVRSQRKVWLAKGEAFFQIKHDAARPFIVIAGDHAVTDIGTKFLVRRVSGRVEVSLLEGRAQFETIGSELPGHSTDLAPGEVAIASQGSMFVTKKPIVNLSNELGWRNGLLIFDGTTLAEAASEFNRYNAEQIIIGNRSIAQLKVNGTFPVHARGEFADVAKSIFGLHVEMRGDETVISR